MHSTRLHVLNDQSLHSDRSYVLYWMTSARRLTSNFALERAVEHAAALKRSLVILEALRCGYQHANDRLHLFVMQGMAAHARTLSKGSVLYYPYIEREPGAGSGLLAALAGDACVIVTDWYPAFFLPRMISSAAAQVRTRMEAVDTNGILPVATAERAFPTARGFRAHLQRNLRAHLPDWPARAPLERLPRIRRATLSRGILAKWPAATAATLSGSTLRTLPIDHTVPPVGVQGGTAPARARLSTFVADVLPEYGARHNQPEEDATSRLSPWLHFGHLSAHDVFDAVMSRERWTSRKLGTSTRGAREGWWNVSPSAESFLDELVTWRELAFNTCAFVPGYASFESLPDWARRTLLAHRRDRRAHRYTLEQFDESATHDPLWNAVQRQLKREGWFHGYMRMLWGKKILEWSATPADALATMAHLMNRYSLDGRDPNSWAGFAWVLGRYDRPWPEREIFGAVRYMSSANTAKKLRVRRYLEIYS